MKTKIILMLVKDSEPADLIENIKIYTGGTYAQVFHMLDYLKTKRLIEFDEGKNFNLYGTQILEGIIYLKFRFLSWISINIKLILKNY